MGGCADEAATRVISGPHFSHTPHHVLVRLYCLMFGYCLEYMTAAVGTKQEEDGRLCTATHTCSYIRKQNAGMFGHKAEGECLCIILPPTYCSLLLFVICPHLLFIFFIEKCAFSES